MWAVNAKYSRQSIDRLAAHGRRSGHQGLSTSPIYNNVMYIVAIAWLYVTTLMALTEGTVVAGILTFLFYGVLPAAILTWLFSDRGRGRRRSDEQPAEAFTGKSDEADDEPGH